MIYFVNLGLKRGVRAPAPSKSATDLVKNDSILALPLFSFTEQ